MLIIGGRFRYMERMKKLTVKSILYAIVVICAMVAACGCEDRLQSDIKDMSVPNDTAEPDKVTEEARYSLYSGGHKTTYIRADRLDKFTRRDSMIAINIDIDFYDSTGVIVSNLVAREGYIRERDDFLSVTGSVVIIGEDSVRIETEYLEWDNENERISTDSFVTVIYSNGNILYSYGIESDPKLENIEFKKQVSGRLTNMGKRKNENK